MALALIPLTLVVVCCAPALVIQPFLPGGAERSTKMISEFIRWSWVILAADQRLMPLDGRQLSHIKNN
jgi:hypothetical protein